MIKENGNALEHVLNVINKQNRKENLKYLKKLKKQEGVKIPWYIRGYHRTNELLSIFTYYK